MSLIRKQPLVVLAVSAVLVSVAIVGWVRAFGDDPGPPIPIAGSVPVPPGSVKDDSLSQRNPAFRSIVTYRLPSESTLGELISFYDHAMPAGKPWNNLKWCDSHHGFFGGIETLDRTWLREGNAGLLILQLIGPTATRGPAINVYDDPGSAACR